MTYTEPVGVVYLLQCRKQSLKLYHFDMGETREHVSLHLWQGQFKLWANCFMCRMSVANSGPPDLTDNTTTKWWVEHPNYCAMTHLSKRIGTSQMVTHTRHNREPIIRRRNFPLGAYTWHWRTLVLDKLVYMKKKIKICLRANFSLCWMPVTNRWPRISQTTMPATEMPSVLATRPWPILRKRISIISTVSR